MNNFLGKPRCICGVALGLRVLLLIYGEWQDRNMDVKFTDVDYHVFDDAAQFVFNKESPYLRATYRYTPLLAWILQPNVIVKEFGKFLFIIADILTAIVIQQLLLVRKANDKTVGLAMALWLFNPITCTVSCRGNAESVMSLLVNTVLLALMTKQTVIAGLIFGISVHFKIYPITYSLAIFLFLGNGYDQFNGQLDLTTIVYNVKYICLRSFFKRVITTQRIKFFLSALFTLVFLNLVMFHLYGNDFLEHTYFYHIKRRDIRHNFSVFFYMLYLSSSWWQNMVCFVLQLVLIVALSYKFSDDLPFAFFLLTIAFVSFNKVVTSQYFIWYLAIAPILANGFSKVRLQSLIGVITLWLAGQGLWLNGAYKLEFLAENTFLYIWAASMTFFMISISMIAWCIKNYHYQENFDSKGSLTFLRNKK